MLKTVARNLYIQKRKEISEKQKLIWDDLILIQFQKLNLSHLNNVFTYMSMPQHNEVNTDAIVDFLKFRNPGVQIYYPVCDFEKSVMHAVLTHDDTVFFNNKFNTPEPQGNIVCPPEDIDLVIVPLLIFDKTGHRIGYGKGFYDKYLAGVSPEAYKIGLSYFEPVEIIDDLHEFDVPLSHCITPERIYEF